MWTRTGRPAGSPDSSTASVRPSGVRTVCSTLPPVLRAVSIQPSAHGEARAGRCRRQLINHGAVSLTAASLRVEVQQLQQRRDALRTETATLDRFSAELPAMRAEYAELSGQLVETRGD